MSILCVVVLLVTNGSGKRFFSRFKRIKNELKGRNIPGEVVNTKQSVLRVILCIM